MGLIGEQCASCVSAAEADGGHGGGLAGRWWRAWAEVRSNQSHPISSNRCFIQGRGPVWIYRNWDRWHVCPHCFHLVRREMGSEKGQQEI